MITMVRLRFGFGWVEKMTGYAVQHIGFEQGHWWPHIDRLLISINILYAWDKMPRIILPPDFSDPCLGRIHTSQQTDKQRAT